MTAFAIPDSATVVVAGESLHSEFADEVVILNLRDGTYYGLKDVGARIWTLLQEPIGVTAICEALVLEYDVEASCCERDVRLLLQDLASRGLVEVRG
jgi:hypothetical protein